MLSGRGQLVEQEQESTERLCASPRATQPVQGTPLSLLSLLKDHGHSPPNSCKLQRGQGRPDPLFTHAILPRPALTLPGTSLTLTPFPWQAFVISFTSDFIPRLVYLYMYSQNGTMHGFVNHTLSSFNVSDFQNGTAPNDPLDLGYEVQICRYCLHVSS